MLLLKLQTIQLNLSKKNIIDWSRRQVIRTAVRLLMLAICYDLETSSSCLLFATIWKCWDVRVLAMQGLGLLAL